jgi:hypothetical protein
MEGLPLEELGYLMYAERYGWTPEQVDALPASVYLWGPVLTQVIDAVREEKAS